jgi:hypothetical protein
MTDVPSDISGIAPARVQGKGDFVNALKDAVRENPISAALIGMGVLWMFMGGSNTSLFGGRGRKSIFRTAVQGADQVGDTVRDAASGVGSSVRQMGSQVADDLRRASATVGETASRTAGQATEAVASAYGTTTHAASRAAETVSNATTTATHAMREIGTKWGSTVQQNIADLFERQPLLLGAVGLAIGAGMAASIRTTEAEKKLMGEASDSVRETLTEKAAQVKEMASAALSEAKAQGLTPKAAGEALKAVGDKVGMVAPTQPPTTRGSK